MDNLSKLQILLNFGFDHDPFAEQRFETSDFIRVRRLLTMAVKSNAMISIVGDRGCGKSISALQAIDELRVRTVFVRSADKTRLLISDIEQAMILDLSEEKPKRGREIRARQLRRVIGEASRRQKVAVVIEEGHRLHSQTLRAIKTLRELDWMGKRQLFSVILIGQSDPMNKPGVSEVRLRSDSVRMLGLTTDEIAGYISKTLGDKFTEEAIEAFCKLCGKNPEAKNFLSLQERLINLMGQAFSMGKTIVEVSDVQSLFGQKTEGPLKSSQAHDISRPKPTQKKESLRSVLSKISGEEPQELKQAV